MDTHSIVYQIVYPAGIYDNCYTNVAIKRSM